MSFYKQITAKPWEYNGPEAPGDPEAAFEAGAERVALRFFMVIASVIFSLAAVTYYLRLSFGDWVPLADPTLLWINTGLLVASSALLQGARNAAQKDEFRTVRTLFVSGGIFAALFIGGQLLAWQQLDTAGLGIDTSPASAFFYLLTGLHGVHLLGGMWVWSRTAFRLFSQGETAGTRLTVELCTAYWHFLLVLWVLLFAVLANT